MMTKAQLWVSFTPTAPGVAASQRGSSLIRSSKNGSNNASALLMGVSRMTGNQGWLKLSAGFATGK